jgi:predicted dehydrogenase/D-arabinose 1-dehydrogenase-like Zn-dependent alcohol dehydrogenase
MKQILQNLKTGVTELAEVPCPATKRGQLLIRSRLSLVSTGTERMLVAFGKGNLIEKARQQPDKVRMVMDKIKTDGLASTLETVRNKLDQALPMGYCNVGTVLDRGEGVTGFNLGDRVASNGKHAEVVSVPVNLCAKVPDAVTDEEATFTVLGAIALQGIRLAQPTLGEAFVVTGLGLLGLLTVQLLRAQGCRVLGVDYSNERLDMARQFGAQTVDLSAGEDPLVDALTFSRGRGVDGVIVTAASKSNTPIRQAAQMCRKRGRIVLVGVVGLELSRSDFYEKELTFQVSCSYGPGRYDASYEENGQDYPVGFVRWTEQRNFEAVLDMLADGRINVKPLISHRYKLEEAEEAYKLVGGPSPSLGIVLEYPGEGERPDEAIRGNLVRLRACSVAASMANVAFIGAGNYATATLIPAFKAAGTRLNTVVSLNGVSGRHAGRKFGFETTTTAVEQVFADEGINTVAISTRHDSHARLVCQALEAGKHVFVEKPLALSLDELEQIQASYSKTLTAGNAPMLMVGYNRRFAPQIVKIKSLLASTHGPKSLVMMVNAGAVPPEHWTNDRQEGGGRIIGEACHFVDLLRHLTGARIVKIQALALRHECMTTEEDKASFSLQFADGSVGTVHYLANGHKSFPKERLEVFCDGRILQLDNFRKLTGYGWQGFAKMNLWRQDKGQRACAAAFAKAVGQGGDSPIPFDELIEVSQATIEVAEALRGPGREMPSP